VTSYLTLEQIVAINADQGGTLNDVNGLQACVHRPQSGAFGVEVFPDVWSKAAAYVHGIATTQYFSEATSEQRGTPQSPFCG
jgi:prophage maintenance system killer protein